MGFGAKQGFTPPSEDQENTIAVTTSTDAALINTQANPTVTTSTDAALINIQENPTVTVI